MSNLNKHFSGEGEIPEWLIPHIISSDKSELTETFSNASLTKNLGQSISLLREGKQQNQEEFAKSASLSRIHLGRLERGDKESNPSLSSLEAIAAAAGKTIEITFHPSHTQDKILSAVFSDADFKQKLGDHIKTLRTSTEASKTDFSKLVGMSRVHFGRLENGNDNSNPTVNSLGTIAQAASRTLKITFIDQEPDVL